MMRLRVKRRAKIVTEVLAEDLKSKLQVAGSSESQEGGVTRRGFLGAIGAGATLASVAGFFSAGVDSAEAAALTSSKRINATYQRRIAAANRMLRKGVVSHRNNGDERKFPYEGNYSKGLPHSDFGVVDPATYRRLIVACNSGKKSDFDRVTLGGAKFLKNPLGAFVQPLEGFDPSQYKIAVPPSINSAWCSAEAVELYWMALARDVSFTSYSDPAPTISAAISDLATLSDFRGPKTAGVITPQNIFRLEIPGALIGPYVSQYLLKNVGYISQAFEQKQVTAMPGQDYLVSELLWNFAQNGNSSFFPSLDSTRRYIRNGRDLAEYVRTDYLFQPFLNAALILLFGEDTVNPDDVATPLDDGHPYSDVGNQAGFASFGYLHLLALLGEVASRASWAAWFQKWCVHRRLRPEEYGGRVHYQIKGSASFNLDPEVLSSDALNRVFSEHGTYFLPQAYPFGCPLHPAYPSGHATVAGACATVLKAWFNEATVVGAPVVPSSDGTSLQSYNGGDSGSLTVGGEINKLAMNIACGRNFAGIHWRSDAIEGLKLGESVALQHLRDVLGGTVERFSLSVTKFDGSTVRIRK